MGSDAKGGGDKRRPDTSYVIHRPGEEVLGQPVRGGQARRRPKPERSSDAPNHEEEKTRAKRGSLAPTPPLGSRWPAGRRARRSKTPRPDAKLGNDPRADGDTGKLAERVQVPTGISDPLHMGAGRTARATAPPSHLTPERDSEAASENEQDRASRDGLATDALTESTLEPIALPPPLPPSLASSNPPRDQTHTESDGPVVSVPIVVSGGPVSGANDGSEGSMHLLSEDDVFVLSEASLIEDGLGDPTEDDAMRHSTVRTLGASVLTDGGDVRGDVFEEDENIPILDAPTFGSTAATDKESPYESGSDPAAGGGIAQDPRVLARALAEASPQGAEALIPSILSHGAAALDAIVQVFPGTLWFEKGRTRGRPPLAAHVSGPAAALVAFGEDAAPHVGILLASKDRLARFCAALVARDLCHTRLIDPLFRMLLDTDSDNADVAMLAVQSINDELIDARVTHLRDALATKDAPVGQHLTAAKTLGVLRDTQALPILVERVGSNDTDVADAAIKALRLITGQGIRKSRFRWRRWLKKHGTKPRAEWLLDGLRQADTPARVAALRELVLLTGEDRGMHRAARREDSEDLRVEYQRLLKRADAL